MANFLTSLKGGFSGWAAPVIGRDRELVNYGGFVSGRAGKQRTFGDSNTVEFFDDFLGDLIKDEWNYVEGTDSATSSAAILAGGIGGQLRITTGDAGTGLAADMAQLTHDVSQWQASNGGLAIEGRFKLSAISICYCFFGFTDVGMLEAPIESAASANTLTSNATDAVGFMFDTRMTDDNWWLVGVADDVDATHEDTGSAPVADTFATFRVEINSTGVATFYYNGANVGSAMTGAVTAANDLTPTFAVSKTSVAASMTAEIDYIHVSMNR